MTLSLFSKKFFPSCSSFFFSFLHFSHFSFFFFLSPFFFFLLSSFFFLLLSSFFFLLSSSFFLGSWLLAPCSLFLVPCSLFLVPCSLSSVTLKHARNGHAQCDTKPNTALAQQSLSKTSVCDAPCFHVRRSVTSPCRTQHVRLLLCLLHRLFPRLCSLWVCGTRRLPFSTLSSYLCRKCFDNTSSVYQQLVVQCMCRQKNTGNFVSLGDDYKKMLAWHLADPCFCGIRPSWSCY